MPITHRQVELFRAIVQGGSLSAAARALHSSQPTLSRELALMEQRLGYALFERGSRRLQPTAAALDLFETVQRHYQGLAEVQLRAQALGRAESHRLQVLALPALAQGLLPAALQQWRVAWPEGCVAITPAESPLLEAWMAEQRHDLGLTERAQAINGCELQLLASLAEVAVLPAGHPLLAREVLTLADFAGQAFVSLADDDPYRHTIDTLFAEAGVHRHLRFQTHSAAAVCALVAQGLGLAIVNPFTARASAGPRLHWRPLATRIAFEVHLVRPNHRPKPPGVAELAAALVATAAEAT
jgi:DNA-binding transcriptional LysR family regulator